MIPPQLFQQLIKSDESPCLFILFILLSVILAVISRACYRFSLENTTSPVTITYIKPTIPFNKVNIPFKLNVCNPQSATEGYLNLILRCSEISEVSYFWGVETNFLAQLALDGRIRSIDKISNNSIQCDEPILLDPGEHQLNIKSDKISLGPVPRKRVPLVVLCSTVYPINTPVVNLLTVIHIKDQHCLYITRKLNELIYVQQGENQIDNHIGKWVPLYKYYAENESSLCIVCQENTVSHILLPCRHACLCSICCNKIADRCPMCRCVISSLAAIDD